MVGEKEAPAQVGMRNHLPQFQEKLFFGWDLEGAVLEFLMQRGSGEQHNGECPHVIGIHPAQEFTGGLGMLKGSLPPGNAQ